MTLKYFKVHLYCRPTETMNPLFERAVQEELYGILLNWLEQVPSPENGWKIPVKTMVWMMSWTIFGVAADWSKGNETSSEEEMAGYILKMVTEGVEVPIQ
ncbi:hypothetical protein MK805_00440 [Shimazuella sp. AN120528]|uniref:hypothetical protein n=1 Tax=Shimazuella soli TaxID=1892854 RepID=UPI001F0E3663|nr:hypothetical protein [Shimazuella soli]MCH5583448.1 hypothetical protein [Shimazuella soli]